MQTHTSTLPCTRCGREMRPGEVPDKWVAAVQQNGSPVVLNFCPECWQAMVASRFATPIPERNWFLKVPE